MSDFVPEGYLRIKSAFGQALGHWFGQQINAAQERIEKQIEEEQAGSDEDASPTASVRRAIMSSGSQEAIEQMVVDACQEEILEAHGRFRNALHKGEITAFYFSTSLLRDEPRSIPREYWALPAAAEVIEKGIYFPNGQPNAYYERRPSEQVLVREEELKRFLEGEASIPDAEAIQPREESMTAPAAERYLTPYIDLMLQAIDRFGISANHWPKKEELLEWFLAQRLPDGTQISSNLAKAMVTLARPPDASKGGNKPT